MLLGTCELWAVIELTFSTFLIFDIIDGNDLINSVNSLAFIPDQSNEWVTMVHVS